MTKAKTVPVYNWQWGRDMQVSKRLHDYMAAHYYEEWHTGGGCMAWRKDLSDGGYLMITIDGTELGDWRGRNKKQYDLGRYDENGEAWVLAGAALTLAEAILLGDRLPYPWAGVPDILGEDSLRAIGWEG